MKKAIKIKRQNLVNIYSTTSGLSDKNKEQAILLHYIEWLALCFFVNFSF